MPPYLKTQSIGEWFGDAHAWGREGLDKFIAERIANCIKQGQYSQITDEPSEDQVRHFLLREAIYLLHAMFHSIEHTPAAGGLDAVRMVRTPVQNRSPLIPPFRELIADFLGIPNPYRRSDEPEPADPESGGNVVVPDESPEQEPEA